MQFGFNVLIVIALAAVVIVLFAGLINMFRGGNPELSQKLMRARVLLQFVAIVLMLVAFALFAHKS